MKHIKIAFAFLLAFLFAGAATAGMKERLQPLLAGNLNISVDTFIIGTADKYIASVVRDVDQEIFNDLSMGMKEALNSQGSSGVVLIEKQIFDKNSKKFSLAERDMVLKSDYVTRISSEPLIGSDMQEVKPGSLEEFLWDMIAGPNGLGSKILSEYPEPVELTKEYKKPVDRNRYAIITNNEVGGIFLDRNSIKKTDEGCSALIVEAFNFDAESHFGGMVVQYAYQPYVDAFYAVSTYEYSFKKVAQRQLRFTIFGSDGKVIYSIKNPDTTWVPDTADPTLPYAIMAVYRNLPKDVAAPLADDIKSFEKYVQGKIAEAQKAQEELQEKAQDNGTPK